MMKNIKTALLISVVSFTFSCKKFLDVQPKLSISDEATITNGSSAETAVRGMYRQLAADGYYGNTYQAIGYLSGDNIEFTGSQAADNQFVTHDVRADNGRIATVWTAIYATINKANHVIQKVEPLALEATFTQAKKNQLLGEAYFVRALAYFDLARVWGGVPIYLTPTSTATDNRGVRRSTVTQVYSQVLSDLNTASGLLPNETNRLRATKKTAWALLARYYLYQGNWAQAEIEATKIIDDTNYTLVAPYNSFFANNAVNTVESVFELSYSATNVNSHRSSWQPPVNGGTRQWAPNTALQSLLNNAAIGGNRNSLLATTTDGRVYGTMYYRSPAVDPAYVIRIAEIRLIRAEARAQQEDLTNAATDLNKVRTRAGLTNKAFSTKAEALQAIEDERRLEFAFEPHRWFDLIRTNRAATVLGLTNANKYVLPLPVNELKIDKVLAQNPGYN